MATAVLSSRAVAAAVLSGMIVFAAPSFSAETGDAAACRHYGGHASVESKLGSQRDITEGAVFAPLSCSETALLFSDIRFKGDNRSNREGNIGLGLRRLQDNGVVGIYGYFDRKKSGVTNKYHSQATVGAEYLAPAWELRANGYAPLSGEKIVGSFGPVAGGPFLQGSGIFINWAPGGVVSERGLWGADVEAGYKIPGLVHPLWLHGGLFSFNGEDTSSLDGARARATYSLTDTLSLLAEGQYDDERGRQGWAGLRLTVPFGAQGYRGDPVRARMTASPVRDVDIVTAATVRPAGAAQTVAVDNVASGTAQRVVYVDNSNAAPGGGMGTREDPYATLAAAQAQMQDNDILYIAHGLGDSTGMSDGLYITHNNVQVIGEGSAFVYDGSRLTAGGALNPDGAVLRAAGSAPVITNTAGDGVAVTGAGTYLTGVSVAGAAGHGIAVEAAGTALPDIVISRVSSVNNAQDGIRIHAAGAGGSVSAVVDNVVTANNRNGIRLYASDDAAVTATLQDSVATGNLQHGVIVYDDSSAGSVDADLGGGGRSSGDNALFGNTLEDLAVDIDGATLSARNNWWGQAGGPYQQTPDGGGNKPQIYYGAPVDDDLAGHWTFDDEWMNLGTGTAYDRSGNGRNGELRNFAAPVLDNGRYRESLTFDGLNDMVVVPDTPDFKYKGVGDFSIVVMANAQAGDATTGYLVSKPWNGNGRYNYQLYDPGTNRMTNYVGGNTGDALASVHALTEGAWGQVAMTLNQARFMVNYVDGVLDSSKTHSVTAYDNIPPAGDLNYALTIGSVFPYTAGWGGHTSYSFTGGIDDVRIYNRALTANEIAEIYRMNTTSVIDAGAARLSAP